MCTAKASAMPVWSLLRSDPLGFNLLGRLQFREEWKWQLAGLLRLFGCGGRTVAGLLRQVYMYFYK